MEEQPLHDPAFPRQCAVCNKHWSTRDEFLGDTRVELVGYQVSFENLVAGQFLLNHECGTTLAVPAAAFADLYGGPVFQERATNTADCPGHCLHPDDLDPCTAKCECAFVREILQLVRNRQQGQKLGG